MLQIGTLHPLIGLDTTRLPIETLSRFTDCQWSFAELNHRYNADSAVRVHDRAKTTAGPRSPRAPDPAVVEH